MSQQIARLFLFIHLMNTNGYILNKIKSKLFILFLSVLSFSSNSQISYLDKAKSYFVLDSNIYYGEKHLQQCLNKPNEPKKIIEAYEYLVGNYLNIENADKAQNLAEDLKKLASRLNNKEMTYVGVNLFGDVEKYKKHYSKAIDFYLQSYDLLEKNKNWDYLCKCAIDLVELNRAIANYKDAEIYIKKAFNIYYTHQLKDLNILARLYNRTAAVKNETGAPGLIDSSIVYSKRALEINQQLKNIHNEAIIWNELGYSYRHLDKFDTSETCFIRAEKIWLNIGAYNYAINAMNNRAGLYGRYNIKTKQRKDLYFKIIDIVKEKNLDYDIFTVYKGLSETFFKLGNFENGQKYLNLYTEEYTKKLEKIYSAQIDDIKEKYESKKIKEEVKQMSGKLSESEKTLDQKNRENRLIYLVLSVFLVLIVVIIFLLYRVHKNNLLLKIKNEEKDALVQEVHHRVKNNLQLINAIMKMQMNAIQDETNKIALNETSRRIVSMALVHEMLYTKDASELILIKDYLFELVEKLKELVIDKNRPIQFELELNPEIKFNITNSVSIGIITSEIISNAIKYAFHNTGYPQISIKLFKDSTGKIITFIVKDNGSGLAASETQSGLGTRLIDIFSRQMEAEYKINNENGLGYEFKIPYVAHDK